MAAKIKIGIHGVPRSGTTWLGEIINSSPRVIYKYQPLFSYELKDYLNEHSTLERINSFFNELETSHSDFLDQVKAKENGIVPVFKKEETTHVAYKEVRYHNILRNLMHQDPEFKLVGIVRSPFATMNSWLNSPREFRKDLGWSELEEWKLASKKNCDKPEEFYGFEKWKEVADLFNELSTEFPENVLVISYDQLLTHTQAEVQRLFDFCGLELSSQTSEFIDSSRKLEKSDTYSVFKAKTDDAGWKGSLDERIVREIEEDLKNTPLEKYL